MLLPEMDSNHQPAGFMLAGIEPLSEGELAWCPEHDVVAPIVALADRRAIAAA